MDDATPTAEEAQDNPLEKAAYRLEAELPSGLIIVMKELTGTEEILAAQEAGDIITPRGRMVHGWAQALRSFVGTRQHDGAPLKTFDAKDYTAESFREKWTSSDYRLVELLFLRLNRPTEDEAETFLKSARGSS